MLSSHNTIAKVGGASYRYVTHRRHGREPAASKLLGLGDDPEPLLLVRRLHSGRHKFRHVRHISCRLWPMDMRLMDSARVSFLNFRGCHKSPILQRMPLQHHSFHRRPQSMCRVCPSPHRPKAVDSLGSAASIPRNAQGGSTSPL